MSFRFFVGGGGYSPGPALVTAQGTAFISKVSTRAKQDTGFVICDL